MSSLKAQQLLTKAASIYQQQKRTFSRRAISKKINEIKYLASQRKVPRLSLRKEIIQLENQLQSIVELEEALVRQEKRDSVKVTALKQQLSSLKKRLAAAEDKDLQGKIERLSHLLAECVSKKKTTVDVALAEKVIQEAKGGITPSETTATPEETAVRIHQIQYRLKALKHELEIKKELGKGGELKEIEQKIALLEQGLSGYYQKPPEPPENSLMSKLTEGKHTLLFKAHRETNGNV